MMEFFIAKVLKNGKGVRDEMNGRLHDIYPSGYPAGHKV